MINNLFDEVENVSSYKFCEETFEKWIIDCIPLPINEDSKTVYLAIDLAFPAFAHWVFESAIFLPYFTKLKEQYPNIKIHFNIKCDFKILFCKVFKIEKDEIAYTITFPNKFIFPKPLGSLNKKTIDPIHRSLIYDFFIIFEKYIPTTNIIYNDIILPRQKKENLVSNDSPAELLYTINRFKEKNLNFLILDTDYIIDIQDQINILSHFNNITLVDGSALLVNMLFVKSKVFHVAVRHMTQEQTDKYPQIAYIFECSKLLNNNIVNYYPSERVHCQFYLN